MELIGCRWPGVIVRAMLGGLTRFSEICATVPGLSDRLLSERLKELETAGIVTRTVYPETPIRIEYLLSEKGRALAPVIEVISSWQTRGFRKMSSPRLRWASDNRLQGDR